MKMSCEYTFCVLHIFASLYPVGGLGFFSGMCGVISAGLAIVSAMGFLMYCGLPFIDIVAASPFLIVGIGVDDMFVMLTAWRKTDHYLDVKERLPEAFSEAAASITITSGKVWSM